MTAGALIVAAGFSKRFGSDKRLYQLAGGEALLITTVRGYRAAFDTVAVVIRNTDSELNRELRLRFGRAAPIVIPTDNAALGMAASIGDGVRALASWDYLFLGLGDMPFVTSATLTRLRAAMTRARRAGESRIVVPRHQGAPGHPVGFSREFFAELIALEGDHGARGVITAHPEYVEYVDVDDVGCVADIDEPPH